MYVYVFFKQNNGWFPFNQKVMTQLFYVHNKLNKWVSKHYRNPNWNDYSMHFDMAKRLGNEKFQTLINKLGFQTTGKLVNGNEQYIDFSDLQSWNKQLEECMEFSHTTEDEFNEFYSAVVNYKF